MGAFTANPGANLGLRQTRTVQSESPYYALDVRIGSMIDFFSLFVCHCLDRLESYQSLCSKT